MNVMINKEPVKLLNNCSDVICGESSVHDTDIRALNLTKFMKTHERCNSQCTEWSQHLPAFICILSH